MAVEQILKGVFDFPPQDRIYQSHFPSSPVVPGSLMVAAFIKAARKANFINGGIVLKNFKFKSFVAPGDYAYEIARRPDGIHCMMFKANKTVVSGVIVCEA